MLPDVFAAIQPLNLVLWKGGGYLCLSDTPVYLDKAINSLGLNKLIFCYA